MNAPRELLKKLGYELKPFGANIEESYSAGEGAVIYDKLNPELTAKLCGRIAGLVDNPAGDVLVTASAYTKSVLNKYAPQLKVLLLDEVAVRGDQIMALVTFNEILPQGRKAGRAVGAFNIANFETAKAVMIAAEAEQQPVIMQVYHRLMSDPYISALGAMMRNMAEKASVPVAVHLDHGYTFEQVKLAIYCGFSSVMFDGSQLPFAENLEQTRRAAEYAHRHGVTIEGEICHVPLNGTEAAINIPLSTPEDAAGFVAATGVDALAVLIGTARGYYREEPKIAVDLARQISAVVAIPLVLHGGSGTPHEKVKAVIKNGFAKVNVATDFQHTFQLRLQTELQQLDGKFLPLDKLMLPATDAAATHLRQLIRMFTKP